MSTGTRPQTGKTATRSQGPGTRSPQEAKARHSQQQQESTRAHCTHCTRRHSGVSSVRVIGADTSRRTPSKGWGNPAPRLAITTKTCRIPSSGPETGRREPCFLRGAQEAQSPVVRGPWAAREPEGQPVSEGHAGQDTTPFNPPSAVTGTPRVLETARVSVNAAEKGHGTGGNPSTGTGSVCIGVRVRWGISAARAPA